MTLAPSMRLDHEPQRRLEREAHWFHVGADLLAELLGVEVARVITEADSGGVTLGQILEALGGEK